MTTIWFFLTWLSSWLIGPLLSWYSSVLHAWHASRFILRPESQPGVRYLPSAFHCFPQCTLYFCTNPSWLTPSYSSAVKEGGWKTRPSGLSYWNVHLLCVYQHLFRDLITTTQYKQTCPEIKIEIKIERISLLHPISEATQDTSTQGATRTPPLGHRHIIPPRLQFPQWVRVTLFLSCLLLFLSLSIHFII